MSLQLVIKVKYGDTLRRFSVLRNVNGSLDLDMNGMRTKIINLFNLAPDADLTLTYIDEDNDVVTLVDDDDLLDVVKQGLNPLRINVLINSEKLGRFDIGTSGTSTPISSPPSAIHPLSQLNFGIEILKSVPEPLLNALMNLSCDLASKAASSAPAFLPKPCNALMKHSQHLVSKAASPGLIPSELSEYLMKLGLSPQYPSECRDGMTSSAKDNNSDSSKNQSVSGVSKAAKDQAASSELKAPIDNPPIHDKGNMTSGTPKASTDPAASLRLQAIIDSASVCGNGKMTSSIPKSSKHSEAAIDNSTVYDSGDMISGVPKASKDPATAFSKLKAPIDNSTFNDYGNKASGIAEASKDPASSSKLKAPVDNPMHYNNGNMTRGVATSVSPANFTLPRNSTGSNLSTGFSPFPLVVSPNDKGEKLQQESDWLFSGNSHVPASLISTFLADSLVGPHIQAPSESNEASVSPVHKHGSSAVRDGRKKKSLSEIDSSLGPQMVAHSSSRSHNARAIKRGKSHSNSAGRTFHRGVRCDGCGAYPITGPRYKSLAKEDYDLCSICFNEMGVDGEYTRMDHPISLRSPRLFKELHDPFRHHHLRKTSSSRGWHGFETRSHEPRLDSCFINDVNVIDGTSMAPKTSFTKIWRMRNSGTMSWPKGTQLIWIGGDQLTDSESVELEIPFDGCPMEKELDIAVDCTAPELPGQYISYWRLALPSGYKFGQCVWVLIQVEGSSQDPRVQLDGSPAGIFSTSLNGWNLNSHPEGSGTKEPIIDMNVEPVDDVPDEFIFNMGTESMKPKDDSSVGNGQEQSPNGGEPISLIPDNRKAVSYPLIDLSTSPPDPSSLIDAPESSENESDGSNVEQNLLKELYEMGFKQIDLNKEILRMNKYNLECSLDDLCSFSEWNHLLEELQEMGFYDRELNRKLLIKNGGSIKRVVMDLIAGEKA